MNDNRCICWYSTDQTGNKVSERQVLLLMFTNSTQFRFLHGFSYYIGSLWTAVKRNIPIVSWVMVMLISGKPTFLIVFWNVCPSQHVFISTTTRLQTTVFWGWVSVRVWSLHLDSWSRHLDQLKTSVSVGSPDEPGRVPVQMHDGHEIIYASPQTLPVPCRWWHALLVPQFHRGLWLVDAWLMERISTLCWWMTALTDQSMVITIQVVRSRIMR